MKFSQGTLEILRNFSTINSTLIFKEGSKLRTVEPSRAVIADAILPESFPQSNAAVYELSKFLSILSLYSDPDITFNEDHFLIKEGRSKTRYTYANLNVIVAPPDREIVFAPEDIVATFQLTPNDFGSIMKAAQIFGHPDIEVSNFEGRVRVRTLNSKLGQSTNSFELLLGDYTGDRNFNFIIPKDNFRIISDTYDVRVTAKKVLHLVGTKPVQYYVSTSPSSTLS